MNNDLDTAPIAVPDTGDDYISKQRVDELPVGDEFGPDDVPADDSNWEVIEIPADALKIDGAADHEHAVVATKPRNDAQRFLTEPQNGAARSTLTELPNDVQRRTLTEPQTPGGAQAPPNPNGRMSFRASLETRRAAEAPRDGTQRPTLASEARQARERVESRLPAAELAETRTRAATLGPRADDVDWLIRDGADRVVEAVRNIEHSLDLADRTLLERDARMIANMKSFAKLVDDTETRIRAAIREMGDSNDQLGAKLIERVTTMTDVIKDLTQHALQENTKEAFLKGGKLASDVLTDDAKKKLTEALKSAAKIVNLVVIERRWLPWLIAGFTIADFALLFFAIVWPHIAPASAPVVMKPHR